MIIQIHTASLNLTGLNPLFISLREPPFELLSMAPSGIERIDNDLGKLQFENRLHPADIKLSEAMATSAAAISYHMGKYEYKLASLQSIQIMLGIGFGKSQIAEPKEWTGCLSTVFHVMSSHVTLRHASPYLMLLHVILYILGFNTL